MNYNNLAISIILLLIAGFLYNKFKINIDKNDNTHEVNIIKKYLLELQSLEIKDEKQLDQFRLKYLSKKSSIKFLVKSISLVISHAIFFSFKNYCCNQSF